MNVPVSHKLSGEQRERLATMAQRLRYHSVVTTHAAGSGHPTSCMSCAEIMATLFFHALRYRIDEPEFPGNDRFILSKGHAAPILWAVLAEAGAFPLDDLDTLRQIGSNLEGHPTPRSRWVDAATGSLGQGLSIGAGMALHCQRAGIANRIWVLLGDSECTEGSVWEAAELADHYRLHQLTAVIDVNALGQTGATMYGHDLSVYERRFAAFGWKTLTVDGHDIDQIAAACAAAGEQQEQPTVIVARTEKGRGVSFLSGAEGRHGKPLDGEDYARALEELGEPELDAPLTVEPPTTEPPASLPPRPGELPQPHYDKPAATREGYANALLARVEFDPRAVVLDAELKNSTKVENVAEKFPARFVECYIAEQNMVGMAQGMAALGAQPFASSFACFLTRAADQLRMAAISGARMVLAGSHAGISVGEDGPSQMGLEDLALFRALPGCTVLCPADAVAAERLLTVAAEAPELAYLRLARPKTPIIYAAETEFVSGGSHTLRETDGDRCTVIACGVTVHEALKAADELADSLPLRVIDAYSIAPLDVETLLAAAVETEAVVTVEDHYRAGGLGEAVAAGLMGTPCRFHALAVDGRPRSGPPDALFDAHGIGADAIVSAVRRLVR